VKSDNYGFDPNRIVRASPDSLNGVMVSAGGFGGGGGANVCLSSAKPAASYTKAMSYAAGGAG